MIIVQGLREGIEACYRKSNRGANDDVTSQFTHSRDIIIIYALKI